MFARTKSSISGNPVQAIILKSDCNAEHTHQVPTLDGLPPILYSMACHRRGASLVACRADPCGHPVDRPPDNCGAESACRYYDETASRNIGRQQAARLAAILPAPLNRRPERMNNYSAIILKRMDQMGW